MVAYRDPLQRLNGRAKRVVKWFTSREAADAYALKINETILTDGTAGLRFDAALRADAIAARQALDIAGLDVSLVELARAAAARNFANPTKRTPILAALDNFLEAKRSAENARERTVTRTVSKL
jgi:hypothetical protein